MKTGISPRELMHTPQAIILIMRDMAGLHPKQLEKADPWQQLADMATA